MALATGLVSYWKLDESSGNAADSVGSNTLTNNGSGTYSAAKINNGFNGTGTAYLSISDASQSGLDFGTGEFSLNIWIKTSGSYTQREIIEKQSSSSANGGYYQIHWDNTNAGRIQFDASDFTNTATFSTTGTYNDGVWHMATMTRSGNTITCYMDGSQVGTNTAGGSFNVSGDGTFYIAYGNNMISDVNVSYDEAGIWSRALTSAEVTQLYNNGTYPFTPIKTNASFLLRMI